VCIASGFVFFVEIRKQEHADSAAGLSVGWTPWQSPRLPAMLLAAVAMLAANRCCLSPCLAVANGKVGVLGCLAAEFAACAVA